MSPGKGQSAHPLTWYGIVLVYLAGLVFVGWYFRNALNTDAIAYLRIASYYANGQRDLAISGYWGPLLSWLMVLPLKAGLPPLAVARGVMGVSALVFLGGSVAVYRALDLPRKWLRTATILSAACGLYWSVRFITPDLMLGGLIGWAMSWMLKPPTSRGVSHELFAGGMWGLAYLAKAVALPLALLMTLSFAALQLAGKAPEHRLVLRRTLAILVAFTLIAGPWVMILSFKYGRPTFSTSARISHALTGPPDTERYHPFARTFHKPEPGRVTSWEEPSGMEYRYWSPLASPAYALHQLKVLLRNIPVCLALLTSLEVAWIIPAFYVVRQITRKVPPEPCWWEYLRVLMLPMLLVLLYVPTSVNLAEQRFFYPAFPFVLAAVALWANEAAQPAARASLLWEQTRRWWVGTLGVAAPLLGTVVFLGGSPKYAGDCAVDLARRIERANLAGPVAGSGLLPGGRAGLYVAFLLNQPWYGDEPQPTFQNFLRSGARLIIVVRESELAQELAREPDLANTDRPLFGNVQQSARFPLQVYEIKGWQEARSR